MTNYYLSPEWKQQRMKRLNYDNRKCCNCGATTNLQVHHLKYKNFNREDIKNDLKVLCYDCHNKYHAIQRKKRRIPCS